MAMIQKMMKDQGGLAADKSKSTDRQDKRELINELKEELKEYITEISDY